MTNALGLILVFNISQVMGMEMAAYSLARSEYGATVVEPLPLRK